MIDRMKEKRDLAMANRHLATGRKLIRRQVNSVRDCRHRKVDDSDALNLLYLLRSIQRTMREHRRVILYQLSRSK